MSIDIKRVSSVYTGLAGACCCGCKGTHRYASAHVQFAVERRGYAIDPSEISDRAVKLAVNRLIRNPNTAIEKDHAWVEEGNRVVVAYFVS